MELIIQIIFMGIIATLAIDVWAIFINKVFNLPVTNWGMVGRWIGHLPSGKIVHNPIASASPINHELMLGWVFHYFIGFVYAVIYLALILVLLESSPTFLSATLFGLITVVAPWFILQPGLGLGICASKTPKPNMIRGLNLIAHSIFGAGLYIGWNCSTTLIRQINL